MAREVVGIAGVPPGAVIGAGIAAGIIGGGVMAAFMTVYAAITRDDMLMPLRVLGATFYGPGALAENNAGILVWGFAVHLLTSSVLGVIFAWLAVPGIPPRAALVSGIVYGMLVLLVMTYLVLPWSNPTLYNRIPMMMSAWWMAHILFGMCIPLAPAFVRRSQRRMVA